MKIRFAEQQDSLAVSELMSQLGYAADVDVISENIRSFESGDFDQVFVAEHNGGELIGVISCHVISLFHQRGTCGRITSLVVSENARGQGVGEKLVEKAESFFNHRGCIKFEVTSGDHRAGAHGFYKSLGYKEEDRRFLKQNS